MQTIQAVHQTLPGVPIVTYSSQSADLAIVRQAMRAGAADMLAAPFKRQDILAAVELALGTGADGLQGPAAPGLAGTVLTVFGAKGGIGKTTITTNVAAAIARDTHASVLVIDLDTRFGDVAIMFDIEPSITVAQVAPNASGMDRATFAQSLVKHSSGVYVLPSPKHPNDWRTVDANDVRELVRLASSMFDYVILDTPGAFNEIVGAAIDMATQVVVVTSVDIASIKDTSFILDLLESEGFPSERLVLTVNHPNGTHVIRPADIEKVLKKSVFWEIPHDFQMAVATQTGQPVVVSRPKSRAGINLTGLAAKLTGTSERPQRKQRSWFRTLVPAGMRS